MSLGCDFVWGQGLALGTVVYELRWPRAVLEYSSGVGMFSAVCVSSS